LDDNEVFFAGSGAPELDRGIGAEAAIIRVLGRNHGDTHGADIPLDPVAAYDWIAPVFADLAEARRAYLDSIDRLVISEARAGSRSLLDAGAGDGARSGRIAQALSVPKLVLLEPSVAMQGDSSGGSAVWTMRAEDLHSVQAEFDIITCLWNVLGHIFPSVRRVEVLRQFARLLSPQGKLFIDLSHRYNARHYGALPTAIRFLRDRVFRSETNGDVAVAWDIRGTRCTTKGHVFTHGEVQSLCRSAGLNIEKRFVVDYETGQQRRWNFEGHFLYVLGR
jgi:2-polyprenyl-3-methyl-5-hydroxy-6-metoxy-1,4-benzoquinol methylase